MNNGPGHPLEIDDSDDDIEFISIIVRCLKQVWLGAIFLTVMLCILVALTPISIGIGLTMLVTLVLIGYKTYGAYEPVIPAPYKIIAIIILGAAVLLAALGGIIWLLADYGYWITLVGAGLTALSIAIWITSDHLYKSLDTTSTGNTSRD